MEVSKLNSLDRILHQVEELDEESVRNELTFIPQKYSELGQQGYSQDDLIKDIKSLYLKLGLNRY